MAYGLSSEFDPLKSGYEHFWGFRGGALDYFSHQAGGKADLWDDNRAVDTNGISHEPDRRACCRISSTLQCGKPQSPGSSASISTRRTGRGKDRKTKPIRERDRRPEHPRLEGAKLATYNKMVEAMDQQIGAVLRGLEETGQADNTIVIFTSDNGGERLSNTWPFSGKKRELLEGRHPDTVGRPLAGTHYGRAWSARR